MLTDPAFGKLEVSGAAASPKTETKKPTQKAKALTTSVDKGDKRKPKSLACVFCSEPHTLERCEKWKARPYDERVKLVQDKRLCFGCLKYGHMSTKCFKKLTCDVCKRQHPTVLHKYSVQTTTESNTAAPLAQLLPPTPTEPAVSCHIGAGVSIALPLVPVKVCADEAKGYFTT